MSATWLLYGRDEPTLSELFNEADARLFNRVINNPEHVLQQYLTERHQTYNLRRRPHGNKTLMEKTFSLNEQDFLGLCTNIVINSHLTML